MKEYQLDWVSLLGLDKYRMRSAEAIQKHWCLVFVAYSLLHLACLPPSLILGSEKVISHPIKTIDWADLSSTGTEVN